jgi:membrane protein YqaA with SNARE-associated domain
MTRWIAWAQAFAMSVGGPGLFLISAVDASVFSLPEVNDILVVWMVTRTPAMLLYYVAMATAGSVVGCLVVHYVGRKGGDALMRRQFKSVWVERAIRAFRRYGVAAVIVPSMMPPPVPLKVFVLAAGVAGMTATQLAASIAIGRGLRYLLLGVLAYFYGEATLGYLQTHGREAGLILAAIVGAALALYYWSNRERAAGEV